MTQKESEDSIDYEFISKYIREGSDEDKENLKKEIKENEGSETSNSNERVEFTSKPISEAKKEFIKHLEDESLSIDAAGQINRDWKRK